MRREACAERVRRAVRDRAAPARAPRPLPDLPPMQSLRTRSGFTLVELIAVVLILAALAGVLVPRVSDRLAAARDARRLADIGRIRDAVERFFLDKGRYPAPAPNPAYGGWDVSNDGDLIPELVEAGYLERAPADPLNTDAYAYRYYVYSKSSYGCVGPGSYYVLGVRAFETPGYRDADSSSFGCVGRDWSTEFAYVTGGGACYQ